jgi:transposase InsO family protein
MLVTEYDDVFPDDLPDELPPHRNTAHAIPTKDNSVPPVKPMYRLSPVEREEVTRTLQELLKRGFIEPSTSPFASPILFVRKKEGTLRMVVDYRGVNKITERNQYPLPRIDDLLDQLNGARVFSSLDLMSGYHQVRITEEDVPKTAFRTPQGLYQFRVLPFGLTNAPATFQKVMNDVLGSLVGKCVVVYMDDILVYSKNATEHEEHLRMVLQLLREHKLYCKLKKCSFFQKEVAFLGHLVSGEGVRADPRKVETVRSWPTPLAVHDVRCFLGLTNYFKKFILGYSSIARPLMDLLKDQVPWVWTQVREEAFRNLKLALTSAPVLQIPDFTKPFEVIADASGFALGAILMQDGRPVAFESRVMSPAERNYPVGEQELLAVVHALQTWRCYLEGVKFTVVTDHNPNTYLPTMRHLSPRQARWSEYLQRFHFVWEYRPGRTNCADPLSRRPSAVLCSIRDALRSASRSPTGGGERSSPLPTDEPRIVSSSEAEDFIWLWTEGSSELLTKIKRACEVLTSDELGALGGLEQVDGVFWHNNRDGTKAVYVPDLPGLRQEVMASCHDGAYAGHFGQRKTARLVQRGFYWPGLFADVNRYVNSCDSCQRNKPLSGKPQGLLTPLPVAEVPWEHVSMDFVMALPKTHDGHDAVLVIVDRFSKMVKLVPTTNTVTAGQAARLFLDNVFRAFGMPKTIVSDRDPRFTGKFFAALCTLLGIKQCFSSAYHPETDGQTERTNRVMQDVVRHYVAPDGSDWDTHLSMAEFAINNAFHESIQSTPFFLNYGRHPRVPGHPEFPSKVPSAQGVERRLQELWKRAKLCLEAAVSRQKAYADKHRASVSFAVGDRVLLATRYVQPRNVLGKKLLPRWMGPFAITEKVNDVAYRLDLPANLRWHNVFHVSLLRTYVAGGRVQPPPMPEIVNGEPEYEVERILSDRVIRTQVEFLVAWKGYPQEHNSWEPADVILENCEALVNEYWGQPRVRPAGAGRVNQKGSKRSKTKPSR